MIQIILFVLAILFSVAIPILTPLELYFIPVLFVGIFIVLNACVIIWLFVVSLFLGNKKIPDKDSKFWRGETIRAIEWILDTLNIHTTIVGTEMLPDEPMVLISNHRSDFDPMAALVALRGRRIAYISKQSNLKIPIAGAYVLRCSFLPIDRQNPRSALRTLKRAAGYMTEQKLDIGIFPEGTRSKGNPPSHFKEGAFLLAKWAKAPVVIMATEGTEKIAGHVIFHRNKVKLTILKVISKEEVMKLTTKELTEQSEKLLYDFTGETPKEDEPLQTV